MENLKRTTEHLSRVSRRKTDLQGRLAELIPIQASIVWEVGCGHGHFLNALAATDGQRLHIGVDIIRERIERATRKRDRARLLHLHFLHAEATDFLNALPDGVSFAAVYVLFPDPWPKRRHHKNRLMQSSFLEAVARRAGQGTRLYFRTDHQAYFAETFTRVTQHAAWKIVEEPWPFELETVFQSRADTYQSLTAVLRPISGAT